MSYLKKGNANRGDDKGSNNMMILIIIAIILVVGIVVFTMTGENQMNLSSKDMQYCGFNLLQC